MPQHSSLKICPQFRSPPQTINAATNNIFARRIGDRFAIYAEVENINFYKNT